MKEYLVMLHTSLWVWVGIVQRVMDLGIVDFETLDNHHSAVLAKDLGNLRIQRVFG